MTAPQASPARRKITLERTVKASIQEVWEMWTTTKGIESWWGPDGFSVVVLSLDLRPGGEMTYAMTATAPEQIEFLKKAGMPVTQVARVIYTEVVPPRRLAFTQLADFIPGVKPYTIGMQVEFEATADAVRIVLTFDAMHDEHWSRMATMGWESELGRLTKLLEA